jgi:hypothetical protein
LCKEKAANLAKTLGKGMAGKWLERFMEIRVLMREAHLT